MAMIPRERIEYSAIVDRPALKLPGGAKLIVWTIVNLEVWDISRPMARQVIPAPTGAVLLPDVPNWAWHEYGMRVGFWRFKKLYDALGIKPTLAINARVTVDYPRVANACLEAGWEFMGHAYEQMPIHKVDDQKAMIERSMDYARYITFQRKLGPSASKISALTQSHPWLKLFLPFIRTPTNLLKFAVERSPVAPLLKEWRTDYAAGGARRDLAIAKAAVGTGMGALVYQLAQEGYITGSGPADRGAKALKRADGWQPFSIRIGDKFVSYQRLDPFSTTLGIAATLADLGEHMTDKQREHITTLLVASVMQNLASKTWLSGLSSITEAIADPDRYAGNLTQRLAGSIAIPTGVAQIARTLDPIQREVDGLVEAIKARVPGLSQSLEPKRDVWGQPVEKEGGIGPDILSPLWTSTARNDPVNQALLAAGAHVGKPSRAVGDREMTAKEYGAFQERSGKLAHERMRTLVQSDGWKAMDKADRKDKVSDVLGDARREVKAEMFGTATKASRPRAKHVPPPPGKSMGWLKDQVNRYDPRARVLPEGDHLHVTFPGYYGAPPLGGAKAAGLRNPNAGMPPPPAGFTLDAR